MPNGPGLRGMPASPSDAPVTDGPLEGHRVEQLREGSVSMENDTPDASVHTQATPIATMPLNSGGEQHGEHQRDAGVQQQIAACVGAEAVGRGMAERQQPRVADHQVEAHGEQAEDQRLGQQRHRVGRQAGGRERKEQATAASPRQNVHYGFLAEQTARAHNEHREHDQIHQGQRKVGKVVGAEHLHECDQQRADQRAEEAAHAADDDDDEGVDHRVRRHAERGGDQWCGKHAADAGQAAADAEHRGAHQAHVGAERVHHLGVLRGGADQQAETRALQELPDRDRNHDAGAGEEQAIDRERFVEDEHDAGQRMRRRHFQRVDAPDQADRLAHDQRQAEGHHQEGTVVAAVEPAQDAEFECGAEAADQDRRDDQGCPEVAGDGDGGVADIGAQHEERAMREVHDAHDAEDQRQSDAEEEQQCRLRQRVQALRDEEGEEVHQCRLGQRPSPNPLPQGEGE